MRHTGGVPEKKKQSFFKRWSQAHENRKRFTGEYQDRPADPSSLAATADYNDVEAFYDANPARRGDDISVGKIDDAELRWSIYWFSKTSEVIARPANRLDAEDREQVPEYVFVVGSAGTEQEARSALVHSYTLETLRDALYR
jgi:hypothetical protein